MQLQPGTHVRKIICDFIGLINRCCGGFNAAAFYDFLFGFILLVVDPVHRQLFETGFNIDGTHHLEIPPHFQMMQNMIVLGIGCVVASIPFFIFIMKIGWIKLNRQIMDWEWYGDIVTRGIFIHCVLRANHQQTKWRGMQLEKGQFVTSLKHLADENGVSLQTIRTHIKRLVKTGNLTIKTTNKFTIVTVCNYSVWQDSEDDANMQSNNQLTNKQHSKNNQLTTDKNDKNEKNEIKIDNHLKAKNDFDNSSLNQPIEGKEKKVAAKKEMPDFVFPEVEEEDTLQLYFNNKDNIAFWGRKYPFLSIENEFAGIYAALQKKAADGNAQLLNPYSYIKKCLENAEKARQQRVVAQKSIKSQTPKQRKSTARADVSDWSTSDFFN